LPPRNSSNRKQDFYYDEYSESPDRPIAILSKRKRKSNDSIPNEPKKSLTAYMIYVSKVIAIFNTLETIRHPQQGPNNQSNRSDEGNWPLLGITG
jgi:hypothetical protein